MTKEISDAMEERKSQYPGLYTEGPEPWDPLGTTPPYKRPLNEEEKEQQELIMKEWKEKEERPVQPRPNPMGYLTTEEKELNDMIDGLDKIFVPTLAARYAPPAIRVEFPGNGEDVEEGKDQHSDGYETAEENPTSLKEDKEGEHHKGNLLGGQY